MVKATNQPSIRLFKNNQDYLWSSTKIHGIHFMSLMYIKDKVCRPFYPSNHRQNLMLKPWFLSMNFWKRHQNDPTYLKLYLLLCIFILKKIGVQFPKVSSPQNHQTTYLGPRPSSRTSHRNWAAAVVFSHCPKRFWWCCFSMAASAEQLGRSWVKPWLCRFWSKILWQRQGVVSTSSEPVDLLVWSVGSGSWSPRHLTWQTSVRCRFFAL